MKLYLVQHADAKREEEDPSRPLSENGMEDIKKVARYLEHLHIYVDTIVHSGKLRAKQTAEVLAGYLLITKGVEADEGLGPLDDPKVWREHLAKATKNVMLVGHLPHLSRLAAQLLLGNESREIIAFKMGGILCLQKEENGEWTLQWMVTPEILP